jgi:hypothetical protein
LMITLVPASPEAGEKLVIWGGTKKVAVLVPRPAGLVTWILPVVAAEGTLTVIWVGELMVKMVVVVVLNVTRLAVSKLVPVTTTELPGTPLAGLNPVTVGGKITMKSVALVAVPADVVTVILPEVVPELTLAVIWVGELTVTEPAALPLNFTEETPVKPVPVMVTFVLMGPAVGVKLVIVGPDELPTVKSVALVAVPAGVVTEILPVVAPVGTVAVIWMLELTVNTVAAVPLNATPVAPVKLLPLIVTLVPTGPDPGEKLVIDGEEPDVTVKLFALVAVPAVAVTVIFPVVAPEGTVAVIWVELFRVNVAAVPLKATAEAPLKFVPVIETDVPTGPEAGENPEIVTVGPDPTVKSVALEAVPPGVVTEILPVVAPEGTVAVILVAEFTVKVAAAPLN